MITAILLLAFSSPAPARTISWAEAVELAKKNNPELAAAAASLRSLEAQEGTARAGFLPKVNGALSGTRSNSVNGNTALPATNSYAATLSGSINLFSGLQDAARIKQAEANSTAAAAELRAMGAKVSSELKNSFEGLRYSQEYSALTEEITKRRRENLKMVRLRFESGRENKGSVLLSQAYLAQAEFDHLQARNTRRTTASDFSHALGLDEEQFEISGEVPLQAPADATDFLPLALATPSYLQSLAQEEASSAAITIAKGGFFPSLDLNASYGRTDSHFFPQTPERWSTALTLTIPLFNGGRDYYATKAATASWESNSLKAQDSGREQRAALTEAFTNYQEAVEKLKVDQSFRDAATVRAEIARTKYNNGLLTFDDWDTIESDLINRQKNFLQSKRARVTAEAAWEQAQGIGIL